MDPVITDPKLLELGSSQHGHVYTALPLRQEDIGGAQMSKIRSIYVPPHARTVLVEHKTYQGAAYDKWTKQPETPSRHQEHSFSLSISRPKIDFPSFSGDNPAGWTRQCEKYF